MTNEEMMQREDVKKAKTVNQIGIARRKKKCLTEKAEEFIRAMDHWRESLESKVGYSEGKEADMGSMEYPSLDTLKDIMQEIDEVNAEIDDYEHDLRKWDVIA